MLRKLLPSPVRRPVGKLRDFLLGRLLAARALQRLRHPAVGGPHKLPGELIVSLTSYPARFGTLHLTLACLLNQSVKPDRTILWIGDRDIDQLPASVRRLEQLGLEIRACEDLRCHTKLLPALHEFPAAFIATADDDIHYGHNWLENLIEGAVNTPGAIVCHRVHRIIRDADGNIAPYLEWDFDVQDAAARHPSRDLLPTGVGGILYPPNSLDPRVIDRSLFERLAPHNDDLWFYWCARMAGTLHKKVGGRMRLVAWPGSQKSQLWAHNEAGRNDRMIAALDREFPSSCLTA